MIIKDKSEEDKVRVEEIQRGACFKKQTGNDKWFYYMMIEQEPGRCNTRRVIDLEFGTFALFDVTDEVIPIDIEGEVIKNESSET